MQEFPGGRYNERLNDESSAALPGEFSLALVKTPNKRCAPPCVPPPINKKLRPLYTIYSYIFILVCPAL